VIQLRHLDTKENSVSEIARCLMKAHENGNDLLLGLFSPFSIETFQEYIKNVFSGDQGDFLWDCSLVGTYNDEVVCALLISDRTREGSNEKRSFIVDFGVIPEFQGRHLGTIMLQQANNKLADNHYSHIILQYTVGNTSAQRVYSRLGFREIGQRVFRSYINRSSS
jgi:ribosomal protein S18 acetylase RimI-like enzyme